MTVMGVLARYSIGAKLLVTPALVTGLLLLVAAAAWYGLQAQHAALERIYEIRLERLQATHQGLNDVRSVNEEVYVVLADYRSARVAGETAFDDLKDQAEAIRQGLVEARRDFDASAREPGLTEEEQAAYQDVLTALTGYADTLEPLFQMVAGQTGDLDDNRFSMAWSWFGNFLGSGKRLNEIQDRLSGEDYTVAKGIAASATVLLGAAVLLAILVSAARALAIRAHIVGAVRGIRDAARQLQAGDLTGRAPVVGRDEVAQSAQAFNQPVDGFQGLVRQILDGAGALATSARALAADAQAAEQGAARQSEATEAVAATMEEMSVSITAVADGAEQLRASSVHSLKGTEAGRQALTRMRGEADRVQARPC